MNLHLDNINPFCKCRQDGIRMSPDLQGTRLQRAKSARNTPRSPRNRISPRPPSASGIHCKKITGNNQNYEVPSSIDSSRKVLLRYTDGGIQRPLVPHLYAGTHALPRIVRRYIGRRVGQYHELSMSQNAAIFINTSKLNGALSIVSHGFCSKDS